jgi:hypothetical protein
MNNWPKRWKLSMNIRSQSLSAVKRHGGYVRRQPVHGRGFALENGNIAAGFLMHEAETYLTFPDRLETIAAVSVRLARLITAELEKSDD